MSHLWHVLAWPNIGYKFLRNDLDVAEEATKGSFIRIATGMVANSLFVRLLSTTGLGIYISLRD